MCRVLVLIDSLPSRYRSTRFRGMGSTNGGWLRVVWFVFFRLAPGIWMPRIYGSSKMRALWSPCSGVWVVVMILCFV
jgi:hypothetical protein